VNVIAFVSPRSVARHKKTHLHGIAVIAIPSLTEIYFNPL